MLDSWLLDKELMEADREIERLTNRWTALREFIGHSEGASDYNPPAHRIMEKMMELEADKP